MDYHKAKWKTNTYTCGWSEKVDNFMENCFSKKKKQKRETKNRHLNESNQPINQSNKQKIEQTGGKCS